MADAPNTSTYILVNPDTANLPNSRKLAAGTGITLQDSGVGNSLTIQPIGNLQSIFNFDTSGFIAYNSFDNTFAGRSLSGGSTISITNPNGTTGNPVLGVINDTSIQKITSQIGGVSISTRSRLNFISGSGVSISVSDNFVNNSADVTITASGSGSLPPNLEDIAALTPTSGSLIVGNGTNYISIPIGPNNTVPTSNGTTWSWQPVSGGGGGTVTSITAGTGLSGGVITTSGTISIANTSVTPGSFTNANITVNAQGQITAASNGSGGGGGTVTSITAGQNLTGGVITTSGTIALNNVVTGLTSLEVGSLTLATNSITSTGNIALNADGSVVFGATTGFVDNVKTLPSSLSPKLYNALSTDSVIIANSDNASTTIVLPSTPVTGQTYKIIDGTGNASNFPIHLNGNGKTIDGIPEIFDFIDIPDSNNAADIEITPNGKYMYIFNYDNTVSVYKDANTTTPVLLTTLTAPFSHNFSAFTPDGNHLYVTNNDVTGQIYHILDASSDTPSISGTILNVTGKISSMGITPNGSNILVPHYTVSTSLLMVFTGASTNTPSVLTEFTITTPGLQTGNMVITPNGNYAYISIVTGIGEVAAIQNASATPTFLTTVLVQANPDKLAVTPDGNYVYAMNTLSQSISLIGNVSTDTPTVIKTIDTPFYVDGPTDAIITPDGNYLYACDNASEIIMVLQNASSNNPSLLKIVNTESKTTVAGFFMMSPDGQYIYTRNNNAFDPDGVSVSIIQNASTDDPSILLSILYNAQVFYTPDGNFIYIIRYNPTAPTPSLNKVTQIPASKIIPYFGIVLTSLIGGVNEPYAMATTPNGVYSYITNNGNNTVAIMQNSSVLKESSSSPSILHTLAVGNRPTFVQITPDGQNVYVLNNEDSTLTVIRNASTTRWPYFQTLPTILTTLTVGTDAVDMAITPNGNILYTGNTSTVGSIEYVTNASSTTPSVNSLSITAGYSPGDGVVTPDGNYAYFGIINQNAIVVLSNASTTPTVLTTLTTAHHCYFMFVTPDGKNVYSLNSEDNFVTIVQNAQSGTPTVLTTLPTGSISIDMAITPNGKYGYIVNNGSSNITVIQGANTSTPTVLTTLTVGAQPFSIAVTPDGNYVLITHISPSIVTVIQGASTDTPSILTTIFVGDQPSSINITPDGNYMYVPNNDGNNIAQLFNINNNNVNIDTNFGGKQIVYNGTAWSTY